MSRRQGRYERRKAKREENLRLRNESVGKLEDIFTFRELYNCGKKCCKGVMWKNSTQRFRLHLFSGTAERLTKILNNGWEMGGFVHFPLSERGKTREIDAPRIQDRQIHKLFTQKVLWPLYLPEMIWNNGASIPGKGFEFSKEELKNDLIQHFREYGRDGSLILVDFTKFFPRASRDYIKWRHEKIIWEEMLRQLADQITDASPGDEGLPLGVEPSQAEMIAYPSELDNYIKCQLSIKGAGHYMDDYYIIVPPDRDAKEILELVKIKAREIGLTISESKTRIVPLTKPFKYCKAKYQLTETGHVVINGNRNSMKVARRKIKTFYEKIKNGEMTYEDLWSSINGSFAYFEYYDDHNRLLKLRRLFYSILGFSAEDINNFREREKEIEIHRTQEIQD